MPLDAFPNITPSEGTAPVSTKPRVERYQFGDGYSQRVGLGANPIVTDWDVVFNKRTKADRDTIVDFLTAKGGKEAFWWTPSLESTPLVFTCPEWRAVPLKGGRYNITAKFVREFDL